jgi:hypothetical protein
MTDEGLDTRHEAIRNASVADWLALGEAQGKEDALASIAAMTVKGLRAAQKAAAQRVRNLTKTFRNAGISENHIAAWLDAHTAAFVKHVTSVARRSQPTA